MTQACGWRFLGQRSKKDHSSFEWLQIALRRDYAGGANVSAELVADGVPYGLSLQPKSAEVSRGSVRNPDLRIRSTGLQLSRLFLDPGGFQRNVKDVTVEGDTRVLRGVTRSFSFPPRAVQ
jgi:hypothetical protein